FGGKRVYFPNLIFTFVRSNLPPNQAVFRVEPHVNKLDVRDYLWHLYGVRVLDVRTTVFLGKERSKITKSGIARVKRDPSWKKVIVTLEDEFYFPEPPNIDRDFGGE
ncbi:ribosomal protein L23/L15e core domain-containing protein, partial [Syncephalis plumigaleata]